MEESDQVHHHNCDDGNCIEGPHLDCAGRLSLEACQCSLNLRCSALSRKSRYKPYTNATVCPDFGPTSRPQVEDKHQHLPPSIRVPYSLQQIQQHLSAFGNLEL